MLLTSIPFLSGFCNLDSKMKHIYEYPTSINFYL